MNTESANMYGLLKVAAPIDAEENGTGNPWNANYANKNDWREYINDSMKKNMAAAGYDLDREAAPGKGTAFQGGYKPGFGRAVTQAVNNTLQTSNATAPAKADMLRDARGEFINHTSNFAHNPYGMGKLQVEGTGKTLGEVSQGWKPAKPRTFDANHNPTFGAPTIVQAPQVRR